MNGIVINIDPVIFRLGDFELRWYSVAIILAVVAAVIIAAREGKRKGLSADFVYSLAPWVLIAGMVGARLFHVFDQWEYYAGNPLYIFQVQQGGLAIWGGLFVGGVAAIAYARMRHIPLGRLADAVVPALLTAQIIGRLGCIVNGDAYGGATSVPWGFIYVHPDALVTSALFGVPTHPYPVYEILWNGAILLFLLKSHHSFGRDGSLFFSYLSLYSLGRFALTFVRQENVFFWQLQQAQMVAIAALVVSVGVLVYLFAKGPRRIIAGSRA
ncbi:MAG: prolipoprotein diacylglyceryl transferase [Planctomycetota bacterium]|jgi:phosphatidylglycerol:prolipoprotein diacylglycerol transferase